MGVQVDAAEPADLVAMLRSSPMGPGLLALCSGERLSEVACTLAVHESASSAVRTALDLGWQSVSGIQADHGTMRAAISDLEGLVRSPDFEVPENQTELASSVISAAYALRAVMGDDGVAAANAVATCRDVYFQMAVRTWPGFNLEAWDNSPIVQGEVRREVREAQTIASLGASIRAEDVAILRQAAYADSGALVGMLRAERSASTPEELQAPSSQDPLF